MNQVKKYMALFLVLAFIMVGCLLLMFDYNSNTMKWAALIGSAVSFAIGIAIGYVFNHKKLLPE